MLLGVVLLALRAAFVPLFTEDPAVRALLAGVLVVAAVAQPVVRRRVRPRRRAHRRRRRPYLALGRGGSPLACFAPLALLVLAADGGLVALWWAFDAFLLARLLTLVPAGSAGRWMVTGAALPAR